MQGATHRDASASLSERRAASVSGSPGSGGSSPPPPGASGGALLPSLARMQACRCRCAASSRPYFCRLSSMHAIRLNCGSKHATRSPTRSRVKMTCLRVQPGLQRATQAPLLLLSQRSRRGPAAHLDLVGCVPPDPLRDGCRRLGQPVGLQAGRHFGLSWCRLAGAGTSRRLQERAPQGSAAPRKNGAWCRHGSHLCAVCQLDGSRLQPIQLVEAAAAAGDEGKQAEGVSLLGPQIACHPAACRTKVHVRVLAGTALPAPRNCREPPTHPTGT